MRADPGGWSVPESAEEALTLLDADWHPTSTRPCPTCDPISRLLGSPFGCARYRIEHPSTMHSWYADPARRERRTALDVEIARRESPDYVRFAKSSDSQAPTERAGQAAVRAQQHGELIGLKLARELLRERRG